MTFQCPNITRKANERSVMDIARGEMVEKELDTMIERRSRQKDPGEESELWQESVRRYNARTREEMRRHGVNITRGRPPVLRRSWKASLAATKPRPNDT